MVYASKIKPGGKAPFIFPFNLASGFWKLHWFNSKNMTRKLPWISGPYAACHCG